MKGLYQDLIKALRLALENGDYIEAKMYAKRIKKFIYDYDNDREYLKDDHSLEFVSNSHRCAICSLLNELFGDVE
jgi:hypothetical protein